jgi:chitinase
LKWYREDKPTCTPEEHYGYVCEPKGYNQDFDWFPDTKQTDTEKDTWGWAAYANVVKMAKDLGCDGVDLDYEEFWHADWHRRKWDDQKFITDVQKAGSTQAAMQKYFDSLGYGQLVEKYASK